MERRGGEGKGEVSATGLMVSWSYGVLATPLVLFKTKVAYVYGYCFYTDGLDVFGSAVTWVTDRSLCRLVSVVKREIFIRNQNCPN